MTSLVGAPVKKGIGFADLPHYAHTILNECVRIFM